MQEADLPAARRIFRLAFGTFVGHPDPENFTPDREYIFTRWRAHPENALVAEHQGSIVGSNFLAHWGSFAFFGPLTIHPELWNRGAAQALLAPTIARMEEWGTADQALFTFAHSPKHIALYQKFGFWPGALTALMGTPSREHAAETVTFSSLAAEARAEALAACRQLSDAVHAGLDLTSEIEAVARQNLGDTLLLWRDHGLEGFAVCHCGAGTEAGKEATYIKFAAARPGPQAAVALDRLLDGAHALALRRQCTRVEAGVNVARRNAYAQLLDRGFKTTMQGVAMHRPDRVVYNRPDAYVLDDLR
ncbi:MAG TPA: GNAT family N-acetyltransferase [Terriglobales bacterium]|nr:GNAT family N-acetyltransferase [Terriglobales bacterium]